MLNPFKKKVTTLSVTTIGFRKVFEVITGDGRSYRTTREDRLVLKCSYRVNIIEATKYSNTSFSLLGDGSAIEINEKISVLPITVNELESRSITLSRVEKFNWRFFKPTEVISVDPSIIINSTTRYANG